MKQQTVVYNDFYQEIPLFKSIRQDDLKKMLDCLGAVVRIYEKSEYLVFCDSQIREIGIVLDGTVEMLREDLWGNKSILTEIRKFGLFGETFVCSNSQAAKVSFVAATKVTVLCLPFERVMHSCTMACRFHHRMIENMVEQIAEKNRNLMDKLDITMKKTVREKISAYLSMQAMCNQSKYFTVPMGRIRMAEYLCVDRSALTRELTKMKMEGLIDFEQNTFRILQPLR